MEIISFSEKQTFNIGRKIAPFLKEGDIICLYGPLGAGKTVLVKGIANGLGVCENRVNSPAFVLVNEYKGRVHLFHFDFYRLRNIQEIFTTGYEEYFFREGIIVIEWAERLPLYLMPPDYLKIELEMLNENSRKINLVSVGERYSYIINKLKFR